MAYRLRAIDGAGGQACIVDDDGHWFLVSVDNAWSAVPLRDEADAFRWSLGVPAMPRDEQFSTLPAAISAIQDECLVKMELHAPLPIYEQVQQWPSIMFQDGDDWVSSDIHTDLFWAYMLEFAMRRSALRNIPRFARMHALFDPEPVAWALLWTATAAETEIELEQQIGLPFSYPQLSTTWYVSSLLVQILDWLDPASMRTARTADLSKYWDATERFLVGLGPDLQSLYGLGLFEHSSFASQLLGRNIATRRFRSPWTYRSHSRWDLEWDDLQKVAGDVLRVVDRIPLYDSVLLRERDLLSVNWRLIAVAHTQVIAAPESSWSQILADFPNAVRSLRLLYTALDELEGQQRELALVVFKGKSVAEISTLLQVDERAVRDSSTELLAHLRDKVGKEKGQSQTT